MIYSHNKKNLLGNDKHIAGIDAARGVCALYVLFAHLEGVYHLRQIFPDSRYLIAIFTDYAHAAVMAFFLLSGFSIHYSNLSRPIDTWEGLCRYYFLRFRRIYPIFLCAVALTLLLSMLGCSLSIERNCADLASLSPGYLIQVLFFLSDRSYMPGIVAPTLPGNSPLWSLSYEIVYYLIYPLFFFICRRFSHGAGLALGLAISLLAIGVAKLGYPNHLSNVFGLYFLWCLGAWVAWKRREGVSLAWPVRVHFLSCYVLAQAAWVLEFAGLGVFYEWLIGLLCFGMMTSFLLKRELAHSTRFERVGIAGVIGVGLAVIVGVSTKVELAEDSTFFYTKIAATGCLFAGLLLFASRYSPGLSFKRVLRPFVSVGAISYALYVIHFPIVQFLKSMEMAQWLTPYGGLLIAPAISFALAHMLEIRWQSSFNRWLDRLWNVAIAWRRREVAADV